MNPTDDTTVYTQVTDADWYSGGINILTSVGIALFWVFDWFPWYMTLVHIVIRLIGGVLVYRLIRSGGG